MEKIKINDGYIIEKKIEVSCEGYQPKYDKISEVKVTVGYQPKNNQKINKSSKLPNIILND